MGNNTSSKYQEKYRLNDNECIICWDKIEDNRWVKCVRCHITLHTLCCDTEQKINNRNHCLCPHCRRVGSLGTMYKF